MRRLKSLIFSSVFFGTITAVVIADCYIEFNIKKEFIQKKLKENR